MGGCFSSSPSAVARFAELVTVKKAESLHTAPAGTVAVVQVHNRGGDRGATAGIRIPYAGAHIGLSSSEADVGLERMVVVLPQLGTIRTREDWDGATTRLACRGCKALTMHRLLWR